MRELYVIYDGRCGLCQRIKDWLVKQPAYVRLRPVPSNSWESRQRFPGLEPQELAVISDCGDVWLGNHAWIICLWALKEYRSLAGRLASPALLPFARQAFAALSASRSGISRFLGLLSDSDLENELRSTEAPACRIPS